MRLGSLSLLLLSLSSSLMASCSCFSAAVEVVWLVLLPSVVFLLLLLGRLARIISMA